MILKMIRFLFGYVKIEVSGVSPERFLNLLIQNRIVIWEIENISSGFYFMIGRSNFFRLKPFLQRTNMKVVIVDQVGVPYIYQKYKKRVAFLCGIIVCGVLLYSMSLYVWDITVIGGEHLVNDSIVKRIEQNYVRVGMKKRDVDCTELEADLRNDFAEISWISCVVQGTRLIVNLEEGCEVKDFEKEKKVSDLVAKKNAKITKLVARNGTPIVKVNQKVKKGEVLISSLVSIYNDSNEIIEESNVVADGEVFGTTINKYEDNIDIVYYDKEYTEKEKKYFTFFVMNYCWTPIKTKQKNQNCDLYTTENKFRLFTNFYLPIGYKVTYCKPYKLVKKIHSKRDAVNILNNRFHKKMNLLREKGVEIIENDVKIEIQEGKVIAKGKYVVLEKISTYKENINNRNEKGE